jgi:hypothetical protein
MTEVPDYILVVYNGDNPFVPAGAVYESGMFDGYLSGGLPRTFLIKDPGIVPDGFGGRTVTLDSPGCLALVRCKDRPAAAAEGTELVRYAAAKVKRR